MTNHEFEKVVTEQLELCRSLLCTKGKEYDSDTDDRFHSFKTAAELQHTTPKQALAGMLAKHTVSVYDLIYSDSSDLTIWNEKITDHINYLLLLKGLIMDELTPVEVWVNGDGTTQTAKGVSA